MQPYKGTKAPRVMDFVLLRFVNWFSKASFGKKILIDNRFSLAKLFKAPRKQLCSSGYAEVWITTLARLWYLYLYHTRTPRKAAQLVREMATGLTLTRARVIRIGVGNRKLGEQLTRFLGGIDKGWQFDRGRTKTRGNNKKQNTAKLKICKKRIECEGSEEVKRWRRESGESIWNKKTQMYIQLHEVRSYHHLTDNYEAGLKG